MGIKGPSGKISPALAGSEPGARFSFADRKNWSSDVLSTRRPFRTLVILIAYGAAFALSHRLASLWATDQFFSTWFPAAGVRFAFLWIAGPQWSVLAAASEVIMQMVLGVAKPSPSFPTLLGMVSPCLMYGLAIYTVRRAFADRRHSFFVIEHEAIILAAFTGAILACLTALPLLVFDSLAAGGVDVRKIVVSLLVFSIGDLLGVLTVAIPILWIRRGERALVLSTKDVLRKKAGELIVVYLASWMVVAAISWVGMGFTLSPLLLGACWMSFRAGRIVAWMTFIVTTVLTLPISAALTSDIDRLRAHLLLASIAMIGYLIASFAEAEAMARSEIQRRDRLLYQADRLKTLRAMSVAVIHEISQPLSTIALEAEGLAVSLRKDPTYDGEIREAVQLISRKANDLSELVLALRQFGSRTDGDYESLSAADLVRAVIGMAQSEAKAKKIVLESELSDDFSVEGIRVELQQTLLNLVRNAIAASPTETSVVVRTAREGNLVEFQVLNSEHGGPRGPGMGIGLIIARAIAEGHGGAIRDELVDGRRVFSLVMKEAGAEDGE